ncbi:hypothetical protein Lser_V15G09959 [Lactuca serriola]
MGGRMHQSGPIQDLAGNFEGKFMCKKMKQESMGDDASFAHVATNYHNKILIKRQVVVASKSISSSDQEIGEEHKSFSYSSCPRKFSSQYAMAGHKNIHRSEWESILEDIPDESKMQHPKLPCNLKPSHSHNSTKIALKLQSPGYSRSNLSHITSTRIHKRLPCALPSPLANPTNTLEALWSRYSLGNHKNTLRGQSLGWPLTNPTNSLKRPLGYPLGNPENSLRRLATCAPRCHLINSVNTLKGPSRKHPMANHTNTLKWPLVPAPRYILNNPADTLVDSSLVAPHHTFVRPTRILMKPLVADLSHPLDNHVKHHRKSELGVRLLSMIHKPCQFRQADLWSRVASTSSGGKQMMKGNIRNFGPNSNNFYLNFLSTDEGASSSSLEGGANSEVHHFFSSSFQSRGGKWIDERNYVACSQTKEKHNCDIIHSLEGLTTKRDNNGEK